MSATMDRRTFLRRLGYGTVSAAAAASGAVDLERLLWMPDERRIFLPPPIAPLREALRRGDMFWIDGLHPVNPLTGRVVDGVMKAFVVTQDIPAGHLLRLDAIHPQPIRDGAWRNVAGDFSAVRRGCIDGAALDAGVPSLARFELPRFELPASACVISG